jgi:hypothetical protein
MKPGLHRRENRLRSRGASQRLEPDEGKLSCPVLRGGSGSNAAPLPDKLCEGLPGNRARWRMEWSEPVSEHCADTVCPRLRTVFEWCDRQVSITSRLSVASNAQPWTASHHRCALTAWQTRRAGRDRSDRHAGSDSILPANDRRRLHLATFTASSPAVRSDCHCSVRHDPL